MVDLVARKVQRRQRLHLDRLRDDVLLVQKGVPRRKGTERTKNREVRFIALVFNLFSYNDRGRDGLS